MQIDTHRNEIIGLSNAKIKIKQGWISPLVIH